MTTGVFVVGALREVELCARTWDFSGLLDSRDWHAITWSTVTDEHGGGEYHAYTHVFSRLPQVYKSIAVIEKPALPRKFDWLNGPWFWNRIWNEFGGSYERYIVLRPDLFLWPRRPDFSFLDFDCSTHLMTLHAREDWVQDQMFVMNQAHLTILSDFYMHVVRALRVKGPDEARDVHQQLATFLKDKGVSVNSVLGEYYHYFIARPNSRHLTGDPMNLELANEVLRLSVAWWESRIGPYHGERQIC